MLFRANIIMKILIFSITLVWVYCKAGPLIRRPPLIDYYVHNKDANGTVTNFGYDPVCANFPPHWKEFAPNCGGNSQSPINIHTINKIVSKKLGEIEGTKWTEKPSKIIIDNNGFTVHFAFMYADRSQPIIFVNGAVYEFVQLHFHFGLKSKSGTEHYINSRAYAMEGHAVFYNLEYKTFHNALTHKDGLVVIGRLFDEHNHFTKIHIDFKFLQYVRNPHDTFTLNRADSIFSLEDIMGPLNLPYYMYQGSLTTPGCNEVVTWCVGARTLRISSESLFQFRQLIGHEGLMAPNIRPLQNRNGRKIFYYKGGH